MKSLPMEPRLRFSQKLKMASSRLPKHANRGLVNPEVTPRKAESLTKKDRTPEYRTHISEPHWQRVISLAVVVAIVIFELYFWIQHFKH